MEHTFTKAPICEALHHLVNHVLRNLICSIKQTSLMRYFEKIYVCNCVYKKTWKGIITSVSWCTLESFAQLSKTQVQMQQWSTFLHHCSSFHRSLALMVRFTFLALVAHQWLYFLKCNSCAPGDTWQDGLMERQKQRKQKIKQESSWGTVKIWIHVPDTFLAHSLSWCLLERKMLSL